VQHSNFVRLDGNGIFLSGYNRNTTVSDNEFSWIGHSCVVGWGYTNEEDGTDGLQPRMTYLTRNYAREIGIIQKQCKLAGVELLTHFKARSSARDRLALYACSLHAFDSCFGPFSVFLEPGEGMPDIREGKRAVQ
jgi:hypothetical protein